MTKFGIGQPVRRVEDQRLITGTGRYTDDINADGQLYGYVLRSPIAAGAIRSIDVEDARAVDGVHGIYVGRDLEAAGDNHIPCQEPVNNRDGSACATPKHPILAVDRVRHVGEPVAFVVASSASVARDAAELIDVDFAGEAAVCDTLDAADADKPRVHEDVANNLAFDWHHGKQQETDEAFEGAAHVTRIALINNRVVCNAMEPRAALAIYDADGERLTVHTGSQGPWGFRDVLASNLGMEAQAIRVITPDVGGGFGMKSFHYSEYTLCALAARDLKRPVKWTGDRSESFISDTQGRDHVTTAELALNSEHRIVGLRVKTVANMGAYLYFAAPFVPTGAAVKVLPGIYDIPVMSYSVLGVFTHTVPVDAYRGAGRPESIYCIERLVDATAREIGMDPAEFRSLNLVRPEQMPYRSAAFETYDSGDFERLMRTCMEKARYGTIEQRKRESRARGGRRGIGICYYIESTMGDPSETAAIRFEDNGSVAVLVGTQSNGQGHETAYTQMVHERLGVPFDKIRVVQGDTDLIKMGGGTGGSRSLTAQGAAINDVSDLVIQRGKAYAARHFEAAVDDVRFAEGTFSIAGTDRTIGIMDLARHARGMAPAVEGGEPGLDSEATAELEGWSFPNGCHIAEVEIDLDTGIVNVTDYSIVDDFGVVLNPLLVEGQVHGGIVQGIGQALLEHAVYDQHGQLLSGSFMDYGMPRADEMPSFDFSTIEVPCKTNAMGVKGCGEAGTVGSPAAVINAIIDAIGSEFGVKHLDMPAGPQKIWQLCHSVREAA